MEIKRFLKQFASQADYDAQKDSVMGIPHVVLLNDTESLVYQPKNGIDYSKEYFTIVNTGDDVLTIEAIESGTSLTYKLSSVDTWNEVENDEIQVQPQEKVSFKSFGEPNADGGACQFICEGDTTCSVQGNIMSLLYGDEFENKTDLTGRDYAFSNLFDSCTTLTDASNLILPATTLTEGCYNHMFYGCSSLTTAPELPATTLTEWCYSNMFRACTSLTGAPELPATTLANYCYARMFAGCTSLTEAPALPAMSLTQGCYGGMFDGCSSLETAPELPATTLTEWCYSNMFRACTSLTTAPELPATILADDCYYQMFYGCTSLTTAPELPATTLASYCYGGMFYACTSLTTAPELPATTLANYCYYSMFNGCTSLTEAPALPAMSLTQGCYGGMFANCASLTTAPELPATTIYRWSYSDMFNNCTSLTTAPDLPATTLAEGCYHSMFNGCVSLNYITMLAIDISASSCLEYWVDGISSTGVFVKNPSMTSLPSGDSGVPTGWEVNNMSPCIINTTSTSITFNYTNGMFTPNKESIDLSEYLSKEELLSVQPSCDIVISLYDKTDNLLTSDYVWEYSKTLGDALSELSITTDIYDISVVITEVYEPEDNGEYYYLMEETEPFVEKDYMRIVSLEDDNTITFAQATQYSINGSEWKKIYGGGVTVNNGDKVYLKNSSYGQNINSTKLISVEGNIMSLLFDVDFEGKTDLTGYKYAFYTLFNGCETLTDANNLILPATTLAERCYNGMFAGCTSLTTAPELPATTLADYCYDSMFSRCTSLTVAPELPATTLAGGCYTIMFWNCTSLTVAPALPATTLATSCYEYMFNGCTSLTVAPELPATTLANYCYYGMFFGCSSLTTAPALLATTLATSCYCGMFEGCSNLTTAPELPATTLAPYCYYGMFNGCTSLNRITMLATNISASNCLYNWVYGVASSGTFVKRPSMTSLPSGSGGIPDGWTVEDYVE